VKVLLATQYVIPHEGGLCTHLVDLMAGLQGLGHQVRLVHGGLARMSAFGRAVRMIAAMGRRDSYVSRSMGVFLQRLGALFQEQIDEFAPEVIHCHDPFSASAAAEVVGAGAIPIVETVHGPALYEAQMGGSIRGPRHREFILRCERRAFASAKRLIAVDSGQAAILRNDYDVDPSRIAVIFNSVNVAEVRRLASARLLRGPREPYFLVPRRLVPKTGVGYAIEALARMPNKTVGLVIAGQGSMRDELEQLAASLGVAERTQFLGSVPRLQLLPLYPHALGILVPSVPSNGVVEATSLAVMEAMACGTVAIASGIGGLAELIADGQTGLLVPPADPEALAKAMTKVMEDQPFRQRILEAAKRKVENDYDAAAWLARVVAVYEQCLAG